jgi:hypothetical protein
MLYTRLAALGLHSQSQRMQLAGKEKKSAEYLSLTSDHKASEE